MWIHSAEKILDLGLEVTTFDIPPVDHDGRFAIDGTSRESADPVQREGQTYACPEPRHRQRNLAESTTDTRESDCLLRVILLILVLV